MCACYMTRTPLYEAHYPNKIVQVFTRASDRYATFTTLLNLNASFAMMPRALQHRHLTAPNAFPILRPKLVNPSPPKSTRVRPPPSFDPFKYSALPPHSQPTRACHRLPSWLDRRRLHRHLTIHVLLRRSWSCGDHSWLRSGFSGPSVPNLQLSFTTAWCINAKPLACPSSPHGPSHQLALHHVSSIDILHPTSAHHEQRDTLNQLNIVNHLSSGDSHWSLKSVSACQIHGFG